MVIKGCRSISVPGLSNHKVDLSPVSHKYSTPTVRPVSLQTNRQTASASSDVSSNERIIFSRLFKICMPCWTPKIPLRESLSVGFSLNAK